MEQDHKLKILREYIKDRLNALVPMIREQPDSKIMVGMNDMYQEMWDQINSLIGVDRIDHKRTLEYDDMWYKDCNGNWRRKIN